MLVQRGRSSTWSCCGRKGSVAFSCLRNRAGQGCCAQAEAQLLLQKMQLKVDAAVQLCIAITCCATFQSALLQTASRRAHFMM